VIPDDDVWDEKWDAPLSQGQWTAVKWLYEDRSKRCDVDIVLSGASPQMLDLRNADIQ
jgi:hypothetical protein